MEGMNPGMAMGGAPATELMMVPDKLVGLIIGRGGEQITRLQAESGCKIQMAQDSQGNLDYKTLILMKVAKMFSDEIKFLHQRNCHGISSGKY